MSSTYASTPHCGGVPAPAGGAGMNEPVSLNSSPAKPSFAQVVMRMRPPGRQTRTSSAAVRPWSGANMAPNVEITRSNDASANGSDCASASTQSTSTPASAARRRACSSSSGVMSAPTTRAPRRAAGTAIVPPLPVPTSTTSMPAVSALRSMTVSPTGARMCAKPSQSPAAQVARARSRNAS